MKISLNMLREFTSVAASPQRLMADLTGIGLNTESINHVGDDWILDVEVTSNRPDCLSHLGVAREAAAIYRKPLRRPRRRLKEIQDATRRALRIEIADRDLCRRYCARVIRGVRVGPSPDWLRRWLESVGTRSINNVADITNYVLLELGHPLHAFDFDRIRDAHIIVRRAKPGETLRTLDGADRTLRPDHLVIADTERAVALAGIMGGEASEISGRTTNVLLESAWFDPGSIRRTAKALGMRTEASYRFERGVDIEMAPEALDRAAALIVELAGGEILRGQADVYPAKKPRAPIELRAAEIERILGVAVPPMRVERMLRALEFQFLGRNPVRWKIKPPTFRPDVTREVDLIEEVARHYGYDRIPSRLRSAPPLLAQDDARAKEWTARETLVSLGYREIIPPAMVNPEENRLFTDDPPVPLANPLSQDASAMRSSSLPSMIAAIARNLDRGQRDLALFEIGKSYRRREDGAIEEKRLLTLARTGACRNLSVAINETSRDCTFFDLKGHLETLFALYDGGALSFERLEQSVYEPGAAGRFVAASREIVRFGKLRRDLAAQYKQRDAEVYVAEVDFDLLLRWPLRRKAFQPFSKFPTSERDFSLLVPNGTPYRRIEDAIRNLALAEISSFAPVERLPEGKIKPGYYSLLLRVAFQSGERTLTSEEVARASARMIEALSGLRIELRG